MMKNNRDLEMPDNVIKFLDSCSADIGKQADDDFNISVWEDIGNFGIESPIEQLLYCALKKLQVLNQIQDAEPVDSQNGPYISGLQIKPQKNIGKFRVDFYFCYSRYKQEPRCLIVECDSQEFHERTERERRYEKARDRFLARKDFKVFHYTGKEIKDRPLEIAKEILIEVCDENNDSIYTSFDD